MTTDTHHPTPRLYVKVAAWLAAITGIEVVLSYMTMPSIVLIIALVSASLVKFVVVVGFFMHLRFDAPKLRAPLMTGLLLALSIYTIVLINLIMHAKYSPA
jgi:cytochrome c oxidase subunit 4